MTCARPNSEYTNSHNTPLACIRREQKSTTVVGGSPRTIDEWESKTESNFKNEEAFVPDYRVSIPKDKYEPIYKRAKKGKSCVAIAADYKVTQRRATRRATGKASHTI